ncbi:MAG: hypothetical protein V3T70_09900, partial [Phycisphaerae bacterium]
AYTREAILGLNENQMGVYGIFNGNECVYIGRGDIRERMLAHWNGDIPCINGRSPVQWVGWLVANQVSVEQDLILEFTPTCNQRVG